jgi:hypothetical protein
MEATQGLGGAMARVIASGVFWISSLAAIGCSGADIGDEAKDALGGGGSGGIGGNGQGGSLGVDLGPYRFRAGSDGFLVSVNGAEFRPFWPMGVNYGHGIPGTSAGEFLATREQIAEFIRAAADLGTNSIRVYTVQSPLFYEELQRHNLDHPDKPLFLLQGAWLSEPAEDPESMGSVSYYSPWVEERFADELQEAVDVVYGNRVISPGSPESPLNYGRAFGNYAADVSPWLLGWLIGREMEPLTMLSTHELYYTQHCGGIACSVEYTGDVLSIVNATPSEALVTRHLDFIATYEARHYGKTHPVAFSNWPTLDPIDHVVENGFDDMEQLDLRKIQVAPQFEAGLFFSYHAYPYYPEFILHEPAFQVEDDEGPNSYLGYLQRLRAEYAGKTLIIAEIGLPSSQGSAHFAASGLTHGGLDEEQQGHGTLRSLRTITQAQFNGAYSFELIDEWWKRAWVVERLELPASRRHLWYNAMSPEQNFGLVAIRPGSPDKHHEIDGVGSDFPATPTLEQDVQLSEPLDTNDAMRSLRALTIDSDEGFLHLLLRVQDLDPDGNGQIEWENVDYLFGLDTLDPARGDGCLDPACKVQTERRIEFMLRIDSPTSVTLSVDQPYDLVGVWHGFREPWQLYRPAVNDDGLFNLMRTVTNDAFWFGGKELFPVIYQDVGQFRTGLESLESNTNFWYSMAEGTLEVRIPWTLLNVTDPSSRMVVDDDVPGKKDATVELQIRQTPEISVVVVALGGAGENEETLVDTMPRANKQGQTWVIPALGAPVYTWATWDENPNYRMYRKRSFGMVQSQLVDVIPKTAQVKP